MISSVAESTFHVDRGDLPERSMILVEDRLTIGSVDAANISLNAQGISAFHACIERDEGHFYFSNLSASCKTTLFGFLVEVNKRVRLVNGDEFQIWFGTNQSKQAYKITISEATDQSLKIRVVRDDSEVAEASLTENQRFELQSRISPADVGVLAQYWEEREKKKAGGPSALRPQALPQHLKSSYHWRPNGDLVRPRSVAIGTWALIMLGAFSVVAVFKYKEAFAPGRISTAHASTTLTKDPAIASQHIGRNCDSCHVNGVHVTNREMVNARCNGCHQAEGFAATVIPAHRNAGISCTTCHTEHRGKNFNAQEAALESCAKCHSVNHVYNGKRMHTPHGGTYGYPIIKGEWAWRGLDGEELKAKPEIAMHLTKSRADPGKKREWLSAQFHAIHLDRARPTAGIDGIEDVDLRQQKLSCTSCHKTGSTSTNVDRENPRKTCGHCHNAKMFERTSDATRFEAPSCASCHVEHIKDVHWAPAMRIAELSAPTGVSK